jgi:hypothetical protein
MAVSAAVAFAVWILVVYVAFFGPLGRAPAPSDLDVGVGVGVGGA